MLDVIGPIHPPDAYGMRYIMVYLCLVSRNVLLRALARLLRGEVLQTVTDCMWASRTVPYQWYSDRGPDFANAVQEEFTTVLDMLRFQGAPMRPQEHGEVERTNQEVQRQLGILLHGVVKGSVRLSTFLPTHLFSIRA